MPPQRQGGVKHSLQIFSLLPALFYKNYTTEIDITGLLPVQTFDEDANGATAGEADLLDIVCLANAKF
jgi:hypothetical protein